ncbi:hypothetical protein JCM9279_005359 [Rhodotorula babjevae]
MASRDAPHEHKRRVRPRLPSIRPLLELHGPLPPPPPPHPPFDTSSAFRPPSFAPPPRPRPPLSHAYWAGSLALSQRPDPPARARSRPSAAPPPLPHFPLSPPLSSTSPSTLSHVYSSTFFYNERHPQRAPPTAQAFDPPQRWFSTTFRTTSGVREATPAFLGQQSSSIPSSRPTSASPPGQRPPASSSSAFPLPPPSRPPSPAPTLSPLSPSDPAFVGPWTSTLKPHRCVTCAKAFARRHDLTRHVRRHTGELPFECTKCGKRFVRSDARRRHWVNELCSPEEGVRAQLEHVDALSGRRRP